MVGIFPDDAAVLRLAGAVLIEAHDEWQVAERRYLSEGSMAKLAPTGDDAARPKEVRRATASRRHLTTSPSIVTEHHDDALNSTTPRDAALAQLGSALGQSLARLVDQHPGTSAGLRATGRPATPVSGFLTSVWLLDRSATTNS